MLRYPARGDLDALLKFINALVAERAMIVVEKRLSRAQEARWLSTRIKDIEAGLVVHLVAVMDGAIVGGAEVFANPEPWREHVGIFTIALSAQARGRGIARRLFEALLVESRKRFNMRMLQLDLNASNKRAYRFYQKIGFRKAGLIKGGLKHRGRYMDQIVMIKKLRKPASRR